MGLSMEILKLLFLARLFLVLFIKNWPTPNLDTGEILISSKVSFGKKGYKYFIGYNDDDNDYQINPLCIMLPKTSGYGTEKKF